MATEPRFNNRQSTPENPAAPDVTWPQALAWAGATGAAMALARLLALRGSAAGWRLLKGTLPPL